jgi:hypothetical protein
MKCWNSAFNAGGSRLVIVVVQLEAVKLYVAAVEAPRKKETQDETQFTTKIDGFWSFIPPWMLIYFFAGFFFSLTLWMTKLRVVVLCFAYFTDNSNVLKIVYMKTSTIWVLFEWGILQIMGELEITDMSLNL